MSVGSATFIWEGGGFFNKEKMLTKIKKKEGMTALEITNIFEFKTKQDYEDFKS